MPKSTSHDLADTGIVRSIFGATVSIIAANTSTTIWTLTSGRTAQITKLMIANRSGSNIQFKVGQTVSAAFEQDLASIYCPNAQTTILNEDDIPAVDFYGNIVAQSDTAGAAPNDVQVTIEVREIGA